MARILTVTVTRNRFDLTKKYIYWLIKKNKIRTRHVIVDNWSTDWTKDWIRKKWLWYISYPENKWIIRAFIAWVKMNSWRWFRPDYILKFDNDIEIIDNDFIEWAIKFYEKFWKNYILSPWDVNIDKEYIPKKTEEKEKMWSFNVRISTHTWWWMQIMPLKAFKIMAKKNWWEWIEKDICRWEFWRSKWYKCIYLTDYKIKHMWKTCEDIENYKF
jgi:hypothetical protein